MITRETILRVVDSCGTVENLQSILEEFNKKEPVFSAYFSGYLLSRGHDFPEGKVRSEWMGDMTALLLIVWKSLRPGWADDPARLN